MPVAVRDFLRVVRLGWTLVQGAGAPPLAGLRGVQGLPLQLLLVLVQVPIELGGRGDFAFGFQPQQHEYGVVEFVRRFVGGTGIGTGHQGCFFGGYSTLPCRSALSFGWVGRSWSRAGDAGAMPDNKTSSPMAVKKIWQRVFMRI